MKKLLSKINIIQNQLRAVPKEYPFVMYEEEKVLLKKYLKNSRKYLEFGLGGSTLFALINSNANIVSIDTNESWINFMKKYKIVKQNLGQRLEINYINIGPTKGWGFPVDDAHKEKFPDFSGKIFSMIDPSEFDVVLVDGRFRVACVLQTIINFKEFPQIKILVHDYSLREDYKIIEKYLDIVENEKTLYVFKLKNDLDLNQVQEDYDIYKYIAE